MIEPFSPVQEFVLKIMWDCGDLPFGELIRDVRRPANHLPPFNLSPLTVRELLAEVDELRCNGLLRWSRVDRNRGLEGEDLLVTPEWLEAAVLTYESRPSWGFDEVCLMLRLTPAGEDAVLRLCELPPESLPRPH
jgi:hypothetical protein